MFAKKFIVLSILLASGALVTHQAHASEFVEGIAASVLMSTGFDVTSNTGNEAKRAQVEALRSDAAEYWVGEANVPSPALRSFLSEMRKEIGTRHPELDLRTINDHELAKDLLKDIP